MRSSTTDGYRRPSDWTPPDQPADSRAAPEATRQKNCCDAVNQSKDATARYAPQTRLEMELSDTYATCVYVEIAHRKTVTKANPYEAFHAVQQDPPMIVPPW
jgi:hypothetical protein